MIASISGLTSLNLEPVVTSIFKDIYDYQFMSREEAERRLAGGLVLLKQLAVADLSTGYAGFAAIKTDLTNSLLVPNFNSGGITAIQAKEAAAPGSATSTEQQTGIDFILAGLGGYLYRDTVTGATSSLNESTDNAITYLYLSLGTPFLTGLHFKFS